MSVTEERPGAERAPDAASREPPRPDSSDRWSVRLVGHGIDPSARPSTAPGSSINGRSDVVEIGRPGSPRGGGLAPDILGERDSGSVEESSEGDGRHRRALRLQTHSEDRRKSEKNELAAGRSARAGDRRAAAG